MTTDTEKLKNLLDEKKKIEEKVYRLELQEHAINVLEDKKYEIVKHLGSGSFGDVLLAICPDRNSKAAIKITRRDKTSENELRTWPTFKHPNVMRLLDTIELAHANIFIMPQMAQDLQSVLSSMRRKPSGFSLVKSWLEDILCGLDYMHQNKFCHLDLKADNVMIDFNNRALLCDFTFLSSTVKPIDRCGAPMPLLPPEVWRVLQGHYELVDGAGVDMWCYGVLAFNVFTGFIMWKKLKQLECWKKDIYPIMFDEMQINKFYGLLTQIAFPGSSISCAEVKSALNFLHTILKVRPEQRPTAKETLNHAFFTGTEVLEMPDMVWIHKGSFQDLSSDSSKEESKVNVKILDPSNNHPLGVSCEEIKSHYVTCHTSLSAESSHQSYPSEGGYFTPCDMPEMLFMDESLPTEGITDTHLVDDRRLQSDASFPCNSGDSKPVNFSSKISNSESIVKDYAADINSLSIPHMKNISHESLTCNANGRQFSKPVEFPQNISPLGDIELNSVKDVFNMNIISRAELMTDEDKRTQIDLCKKDAKNSSRTTACVVDKLTIDVTSIKTAASCDTQDHIETEVRDEIFKTPKTSDVIEVSHDAAPIRQSRRKQVRRWFHRMWTRFCTCGSGAVGD